MRIEVYRIGDIFVAYDKQGNRIKDRNILDQISFDQIPGLKVHYEIDLPIDTSQKPAIINAVDININTGK
jgi:hypothetical protein